MLLGGPDDGEDYGVELTLLELLRYCGCERP
jgi:hypothetical protein